MNQIVSFILLILIAILAYRTFLLILEARMSKRFVLKSFLQDEEESDEKATSYSWVERITSFKKYKKYLEATFEEAGLDLNPTTFTIQRVLMGIGILMLMGFLYKFSGMTFYLFLSIPFAIIAYMLPMRSVKKAKDKYKQKLKMELPEFLSCFIIYLQSGFTPYEATKRSVEYAGEILKPHVERLITQIELYPASQRPYDEFAENVGIREAREFVVALNQIMKVDAESADRILQDQLAILNALEEEAYNELIEQRPEQVEKYTMAMLFPLIAVAFTFVIVMIAHAFSQI